MSFPSYPEYKDSGVEWLGDVPEHWVVTRFKRVFGERDERSDTGAETLLSVSAYTGVSPRAGFVEEGDFLSRAESLEGYKVCYPDDLVINIMLAWNRGLGFSKHHGIVSPAYCVFDVIDDSVSRYLDYLVRTDECTLNFKAHSTGVMDSRLRLYPDVFGQLVTALPTVTEQRVIAAFLDHETAKIDALVSEQEKLITLLKEKRQAVISHAVTKGINPDSPMRDSGIEWLGEVPAHWEVCHLKRMTSLITDGAHISPETDGGVFDFVSTKDVVGDTIDFEGALKTSPESYEYLVRTGCQPLLGDVLFSKDGTIGRTVVVEESRAFVVASSLIIIRPTAELLAPRFLNYLCQSDFLRQQVDRFVKGAGLPRLSIQNLLKVVGIFPTLPEQDTIASFLDQQIEAFALMTGEAEAGIALLKERRSVLISAAVTGKIDVRGFGAQKEAA